LKVFSEYFKELEEESIRDNFVIIYELLDEFMDFGYPQTTDTKILQEFITQEGQALEGQVKLPPAVTNAVSWRAENIKYRKNEVFLDVIESVNILVSATGTVLRSEIVGAIKMRVYLSGMPELRLGLNDKILFENTGRKVLQDFIKKTFQNLCYFQAEVIKVKLLNLKMLNFINVFVYLVLVITSFQMMNVK
jgi:AP-1 complex subunit mu